MADSYGDYDLEYTGIRKTGETYSACAPAKLNITLEIGALDSDTKLHRISSVMQAITLHDRITLRKVEAGHEGIEGFSISDNIVEKSIEELSRQSGKELHCRIGICKSIPIAAGMGGGSSDAAAALRLANRAYGLEMGMDGLERVARKIGNDISFLLHGGRAVVEGAESHSIRAIDFPILYYLIARPMMELSTREMYALHDKTGKSFTELASELCPDTGRLLRDMKNSNPVESGVTGKGPTAFAGYGTYAECKKAADSIRWFKGECFIERPVGPLSL
jgi:4-diphosphocytidyl-2C-methyl-D-erythritol kinase